MAGPAERIAWQDFLLLAGSAGSEKNGTRKCAVKTLDTVFIDPETHQPNWFFTTKSGCISRKKPDSVTLSSVADRFARFSLANPSNFEQLVGKYFSENGSRQPLKQEQLVQLLEKDFGKLLEPGSFLQVYLRPRKGNDVVYLCKSSRAGGKGSQDYKHLLTASKSHSEVAELTAIVEPQAHAAATAVAKFFADSKSMAVLEAELEFIVDDNDHVWLSRVAHMVAQFEPDLLDNSQTAQMKQASFNEEKSAADVISKKDSPDKSRSPTTKTPTSTDSRTSKLPPTDRKNNQAEKTLAHDSSAIEVKGIEDQSPDQEMSVASASSRALQPKGDNVKKKKKDVVKHEKKKSKLDEPPSFELLAKFAAERDRYGLEIHLYRLIE